MPRAATTIERPATSTATVRGRVRPPQARPVLSPRGRRRCRLLPLKLPLQVRTPLPPRVVRPASSAHAVGPTQSPKVGVRITRGADHLTYSHQKGGQLAMPNAP